ncbi:LAMI_0G07668g1_1 [Lachancea mirantina]|uniref:Ribokinase n=1 Tax=Lachancea mirantina TaxID=1230905 RepID=A0A1G4K9P4_9SACH|nr:LAMI_0G07668g1_1 [Lachancea mirantina]
MLVTVFGSLNYDLVTFTKRVPNAGETFAADRFETHIGGKGLNQAVALAKLRSPTSNIKVEMIGSVGKDAFGEEILQCLQENGVCVEKIRTLTEVKTGVATILVEENSGQNRILIAAGANGCTDYVPETLEKLFPSDNLPSLDYVIFQNEIPGTIPTIQWLNAHRPGHKIVYNPSPFKETDKQIWELVDVLVVNEIEALQIVSSVYSVRDAEHMALKASKNAIMGYKSIANALTGDLLTNGDDSGVIITLGELGVVFKTKKDKEASHLEAAKVAKVVDTTGAGDTFLGAVVTQLCSGESMRDAVAFAVKASAIGIQRSGAAESIPLFNEIL